MNFSTRRQCDAATRRRRTTRWLSPVLLLAIFAFFVVDSYAQDLTTLETAIRTGTSEEKRDALFQVRNLRSEIASRIAVPALQDTDPVVRATAASSVVFLPKSEAVAVLTPQLSDKDAFVRKESAYALGKAKSPDAAAPLIVLLRREKDLEVRSAAVVALGQTGSPTAVEPLIAILRGLPKEDEEFIRRSAARSIGQIAQINRTGGEPVVTPQSFLPEKFKQFSGADLASAQSVFSAALSTLTAVLRDDREADDMRREAAFALGSIGSRNSKSVLEDHRNSPEPYIAEIAREALAKIARVNPVN